MKSFDKIYWLSQVKRPDWYIEFALYINNARKFLGKDSEELNKISKKARNFFEQALLEDKVCLAFKGPDLDTQRLPIDTIVIHHTSAEPGYRLSYLNATHMLNIYAPYFTNPTDKREKSLKGQPLWSGHFKNGKQVFWGYHWLMRMNGTFEKLLDDGQIGWHAGNWGVNRRSVGICLDNDYERQDPTDDILQKLAAHIKKCYPNIRLQNIIGHREARLGTICPGTNFLSNWKAKLLNYM